MIRILFFFFLISAGLQLAPAQNFPKFPQQAHVTTAQHVKNYWTRTLRWHMRSTRNNSIRSDKKRFIGRIEAGLYDEYAALVAQRSNLAFLKFKRRGLEIASTQREIAALEHSLHIRKVAAINRDPVPPANPDPAPVRADPEDATRAQPNQEALLPEEIEDCPPVVVQDVRRPRREDPYLSPLRRKPWPVRQRPTRNHQRQPSVPQSNHPAHRGTQPTRSTPPPPQEDDPPSQPDPPSRPDPPAPPRVSIPAPEPAPRLVPHVHPAKR